MSHKKPNGSSSDAELEGFKLALLEVLDEYRDRWLQLLDGKALRIGREGQPAAVVIAYEDFEAMLERIENLEDERDAREILEAIERGEETTITQEQLKAELRAEGILDG
jgi:PHD/YefM family antitoxin component YafN of YafNO toxin-antitoxin module